MGVQVMGAWQGLQVALGFGLLLGALGGSGVVEARYGTVGGAELMDAPRQDVDDETLSPYFRILGEESAGETLPLKSTSADIDIAGVVAEVTVTQVYANTGDHPIEAIYVFPGSTRAAVHGMTMTIGDRTLVADIQRKAEARANYEAAKAAGQSASLLEQERPNVFTMNVANILPGDEIEVTLSYSELLVPTDGIYEFVYPTVVGPRYAGSPGDGTRAGMGENYVANPYLHEGEAPTYLFDLEATLSTGLPIQGVASPTHEVEVTWEEKDRAIIELGAKELDGGNRDFVLRYRLEGGKVETGVLLFEGEEENFFLLMAQPPKRVTPDVIPPREYIFVVDVSGSMGGFPLDTSKALMKELLNDLRPEDRFNVMLFSGGNTVLSETSLPATQANLGKALNIIDNQHGGGGTQLLPAMKRALALPRADANIARSMVVVTDGYVSVEEETFELIRQSLDESSVFSFGIGSGVNRFIIEGMARVGQGEPAVILNPGEAQAKAAAFRKQIEFPVLTGIQADFDRMRTYDVEPPAIPDLMAERPVVVMGKYKGDATGVITLSGRGADGVWEQEIDLSKVRPQSDHAALRHLWARQRIATLGDFNKLTHNDKRVEEITQLGLNYGLLTEYTSFVAIDSLVRTDGKSTTVKQPLPLPQGVGDGAVAGLGGGGYGAAMGGSGRVRTQRKSKAKASTGGGASSGMLRLLGSRGGERKEAPAPVDSFMALAPAPAPVSSATETRDEAQAVSSVRTQPMVKPAVAPAKTGELLEEERSNSLPSDDALGMTEGETGGDVEQVALLTNADSDGTNQLLTSGFVIESVKGALPMAPLNQALMVLDGDLGLWLQQVRGAGIVGPLRIRVRLDGEGQVVSIEGIGLPAGFETKGYLRAVSSILRHGHYPASLFAGEVSFVLRF